MSGFGKTAHEYKSAGWNVVPIPHGSKQISVVGYTGRDGIDASGADIQAWIDGGHSDDNIGLRMPENIIGIDVDVYHEGRNTLDNLIYEHGQLPATPRTTSRADGSGISFYRVPEGTLLPSGLGRGVDIIRRAHRYAVVHPSKHPDTGRIYRWRDIDGNEVPAPAVSELPQLPRKWVAHLNTVGKAPTSITDPHGAPVSLTDGPMHPEVSNLLARGLEAVRGESGSRHDAMLEATGRLVRLGHERASGTAEAMASLRAAYIAAIGDDRPAAAEFDRLVAGAQSLVGRTPSMPTDSLEDGVRVVAPRQAQEVPPPRGSIGPVARRAVDMAGPAKQEWLAQGRIPHGKLSLLVGDEGIGKSAWWVWLVSRLTTGTAAPEFGITSAKPREVVLIITEDLWSTDVLPRLMAAGADLSRVRVVSQDADGEGSPTLPDHLDRIPDDADLVIVDAWSDTLPANLSVRDSQQARRALHPLKEWAARTGTSMLLVVHTNRLSTGSTRDAYGSTGELRKAARSSLLAQREPDTEDIFTVGTDKSNGARVGVASRFQTFGAVMPDGIETVAVRFLGQSDLTAAQQFQAVHDAGDDQGESKDCVTWLREFLTVSNGSAESKIIKAAAKAEMFSDRALGNAKRALGVKSMKAPGVDNGPWLWVLPIEKIA